MFEGLNKDEIIERIETMTNDRWDQIGGYLLKEKVSKITTDDGWIEAFQKENIHVFDDYDFQVSMRLFEDEIVEELDLMYDALGLTEDELYIIKHTCELDEN
tara:strand:+ start:380 stop:685 length:306 start_codon:yes stop_codon:yes gene_type:complete